MARRSVPADGGMLFDMGIPPERSRFWMCNTVVSLDMVFIKPDGTIDSIAENAVPFSLDGVASQGDPGDKPAAGKQFNEVKSAVESALAAAQARIAAGARAESIAPFDRTLPGSRKSKTSGTTSRRSTVRSRTRRATRSRIFTWPRPKLPLDRRCSCAARPARCKSA